MWQTGRNDTAWLQHHWKNLLLHSLFDTDGLILLVCVLLCWTSSWWWRGGAVIQHTLQFLKHLSLHHWIYIARLNPQDITIFAMMLKLLAITGKTALSRVLSGYILPLLCVKNILKKKRKDNQPSSKLQSSWLTAPESPVWQAAMWKWQGALPVRWLIV